MNAEPLRRIARVERQVRRARLPHPQQRGHQLRADRSSTPHHRLGPAPRAGRSPRQPPRPRLQLPVTDTITAHHRHRIRAPPPPAQRSAPAPSPPAPAAAVSFHPATTCARSAASSTCTCCSRISGPAATAASTRPSRAAMPCTVSASNRSAAAVSGPAQPAQAPLGAGSLGPRQTRSNRACAGPGGHRRPRPAARAARRPRRRGIVLHREHHLEQRVTGQRPVRGQLLHQPLKRHVLMLQRPQPRLPHPAQQLRERRIPATGRCAAPAC